MKKKMKICETCGVEKPASEFSKSYKNRCKECVAEQTRAKRANRNKTARSKDVQDQDFWDNLLYQYAGMALSALLILPPKLSPRQAAYAARAYASELVEQMRRHTLKTENSNEKTRD